MVVETVARQVEHERNDLDIGGVRRGDLSNLSVEGRQPQRPSIQKFNGLVSVMFVSSLVSVGRTPNAQ